MTTETTTSSASVKPAAKRKPVTRKVSQRNLPPQVIGEMYLIPLANIRVSDQVRTEFNKESIAELAAEIEERGLRSPIEVSPIGDELYELTTGERRLRAIQKLGHKAIPAIIVKTSDDERLLVQLAENIQREDLSLKDTIKAVRVLYDRYGKADDVARTVKKSKAWVSKHLAASFDNFCWHAKNLMEDGFEDLELLGVVNQAHKEIGLSCAADIAGAIHDGCGRDQARKLLKSAKANKAKIEATAQQSLPGVESVTVQVTTTETKTTGNAEDIKPPAPPSTQKKKHRRPLEIIPFLRELVEFDYPVLAYEPESKKWKIWDKKSPFDAKQIEDGTVVFRLPDEAEIME